MKTILLDCDGPLADFDKSAIRFLRTIVSEDWVPPLGVWGYIHSLLPDCVREFEAHCMAPGFVANMEPVKGAKEALERLQQMATVYAVTTPWPGAHHWPGERIAWLERLGIPHHNIVLTGAKYLVRGDILVDDRIENLTKWLFHHPGGTAVLWKTHGNYFHWDDPRVVAIDGWNDDRFWSEVVK